MIIVLMSSVRLPPATDAAGFEPRKGDRTF